MYANTSDNLLTDSFLPLLNVEFMDYDHANKGQRQVIRFNNLEVNQTIYIRFNMIGRNYTIINGQLTVLQSNKTINYCQDRSKQIPESIYCSQCPLNYKGSFCDTFSNKVAQNQEKTMTFQRGQFQQFSFPRQVGTYLFQFHTIANVFLFIQFTHLQNQTAGLLNYWHEQRSATKGIYRTQGHKVEKLFINTDNVLSLSIGIINLNYQSVNVTMSYDIQMQQDVQQILVVVVISFIVIGIVVAMSGILIRDCRRNILIEENIIEDSLSAQQILRYFPKVQFHLIKYFKDEQTDDGEDYQCMICLAKIKSNDKIKVAYCRHFYHDDCLMQWFSASMNCPYCRSKFTKTQVMAHYEGLLAKYQKKSLEGLQLVECILKKHQQTYIQSNLVSSISMDLK